MGTDAKRPLPPTNTPDGTTKPFVREGLEPYLKQERQQSGGLSDDPTESGAPVKNKQPFRA